MSLGALVLDGILPPCHSEPSAPLWRRVSDLPGRVGDPGPHRARGSFCKRSGDLLFLRSENCRFVVAPLWGMTNPKDLVFQQERIVRHNS